MIKFRQQWLKDQVNLDRLIAADRRRGEFPYRTLSEYPEYLFYLDGRIRNGSSGHFIEGISLCNGNQVALKDRRGHTPPLLRKKVLLQAWPKPYPLAEVHERSRVIWFHNGDVTDHRIENLYRTHTKNHRAMPQIREGGWLHHPIKLIDIDSREVYPQFSVATCAVGLGMDPIDVLSLAVRDAKHCGYIFELDHTKPWSETFKPKRSYLTELLP